MLGRLFKLKPRERLLMLSGLLLIVHYICIIGISHLILLEQCIYRFEYHRIFAKGVYPIAKEDIQKYDRLKEL